MAESFFGGRDNAERVRLVCEQAQRVIAAGKVALEALEREPGTCECFWAGGRAKYVRGSQPVHRCGR